MGLQQVRMIDFPVIREPRGNLAVVEQLRDVPFQIARSYWLFDVPTGSHRGGHAHKELQQLLVALSGSFDVVLDDGKEKAVYTLNRPDRGLYLPTGVWRELENFSSGAICMVLASLPYDESEYIRDYDEFRRFLRK